MLTENVTIVKYILVKDFCPKTRKSLHRGMGWYHKCSCRPTLGEVVLRIYKIILAEPAANLLHICVSIFKYSLAFYPGH